MTLSRLPTQRVGEDKFAQLDPGTIFMRFTAPTFLLGEETMEIKILLVCSAILLNFMTLVSSQDGSIQVTRCDRNIASIMCSEQMDETAACALLMPLDEQEIFSDCAEKLEISTSKEWLGILGGICAQDDPAQTVLDLIYCWDEKMNATIDTMEDDKVYPFEHFMCKEKLYTDAIKKTDCSCQLQKGKICQLLNPPSLNPLNPPLLNPSKIG